MSYEKIERPAVLGESEIIPLAKHAKHDQKSHGKWARGGKGGSASEMSATAARIIRDQLGKKNKVSPGNRKKYKATYSVKSNKVVLTDRNSGEQHDGDPGTMAAIDWSQSGYPGGAELVAEALWSAASPKHFVNPRQKELTDAALNVRRQLPEYADAVRSEKHDDAVRRMKNK